MPGTPAAEAHGMPYVITEKCAGACDTACVDVCPVDCIHGPVALDEVRAIPREARPKRLPLVQLYIDPDLCICCGACASECPVEAIYDEDDVPHGSRPSIAANAAFFRR
jgi:ferredoxin